MTQHNKVRRLHAMCHEVCGVGPHGVRPTAYAFTEQTGRPLLCLQLHTSPEFMLIQSCSKRLLASSLTGTLNMLDHSGLSSTHYGRIIQQWVDRLLLTAQVRAIYK